MAGAHRRRGSAPALTALLAAVVVALLGADGGYLGGVRLRASRSAPVTSAAPAGRQEVGTPLTTPPRRDLRAGLLAPEDFDGNYVLDPAAAPPILAGSRCMAALAGPGHPVRSAQTYLYVANYDDVPAVLERVDAYRSTAASLAAWRSGAAALRRCRTFTAAVEGTRITATLAPLAPGAIGLGGTGTAVAAARGAFAAGGLAQSLELALVAGHDEVLLVVELDRLPPLPSERIYDQFPSAVVTAYGKLS